jgi:hypothetical protein
MIFKLAEPHFQHQQNPQPMGVVAAARLMLAEHSLEEIARKDTPIEKTRAGEAVP